MLWTTLVFCCYAVTLAYSSEQQAKSRLVNTPQGPIRGHKAPNHDIYEFFGIPYATAPVGPDKFKAPLPPPSWSQPLEAVNKGIVCPQVNLFLTSNLTVQEDCLIANVHVPITEEKNLPVLISVHGGAFHLGYGNWMTLRNFMKNSNVITVTFNYRLGIHGFLCLGTEDAPGNAGMKDQVALLRWVKTNIASFGGNPDDVTISGYSAGATSVDLLMLSKAAEGLFHKVIPESGANIAAWAVQSDPLDAAKKYAESLNFSDVDDVYALGQFYKTATIEQLFTDVFLDIKNSNFVFSPCVERDLGKERFLDDAPLNILKKGDYIKVPMLYGFANMEGLLRMTLFDSWKNEMNDNFSEFLPSDLQFDNEDKKMEMAKEIKEYYFDDHKVDENSVLSYIDYFSDVMFRYATLKAVELHLKAGHNQIYLYEYSYVDENVPFVSHTETRGANHCAQSEAVYDGIGFFNSNEDNASEGLRKMKSIVRRLWMNFVKTGKPVPENSDFPSWPPVSSNLSPHMSLDATLELRDSLHPKMVHFWDEIYSKHYRLPIPPPRPPRTEF